MRQRDRPGASARGGRPRSGHACPTPSDRCVFDHIEQWADEFVSVAGRAAHAARQPDVRPPSAPPCCASPAEDRADAISAKLLASLLMEQGLRPRSNGMELEDEARPDAVVISALPPDAVTAARRCCRVVRQRWHDVPILVGLWNANSAAERARQRLEAVGATGDLHELCRVHCGCWRFALPRPSGLRCVRRPKAPAGAEEAPQSPGG